MATLTHQAFLYGSQDEFLAAMVPFIREGLEGGDTVFVAAKRANLDELRNELGPDARLVDFRDGNDWYRNPHATLDAYRRYLDQHGDGKPVRVIGEPVWPTSRAAVREWARYESVINTVLEQANALIVCPYDTTALSDDILDHAAVAHPELVVNGTAEPSTRFSAPHEFPSTLPLPARPEHSLEFEVQDAEALSGFRRVVTARALEAGVPPERVQDLAVAASEVAQNALQHGCPPAQACMGIQDDEFVCQLLDYGEGILDPLAGWTMPGPASVRGRGLALARRLCDAVEIARHDKQTVVSLHMSVARPSRPGA